MRVFHKYTPRRIARYVMSFFRGSFLIEGLGVFHFNHGRIVVDRFLTGARLKICREVNLEISLMQQSRAC